MVAMQQKIITVDGPSGSGKGTISQLLAKKLGWHLLDSGALYRALGVIVKKKEISLVDVDAVARLAQNMDLHFEINDESKEVEPYCEGENLSTLIRTDEAGQVASQVAAILPVREALLKYQRDFYQLPGLVADGRDMGTVVFKEAPAKVFLTASVECRAKRRFQQLKSKGMSANMRAVFDSIKARDERDKGRSVSPLVPAKDALVIDSSNMTVEDVFFQVLEFVEKKLS